MENEQLDRATLIERCAAHFERQNCLRFPFLVEVGDWNRAHPGATIELEDIHFYHRTLMELMRKARVFTL